MRNNDCNPPLVTIACTSSVVNVNLTILFFIRSFARLYSNYALWRVKKMACSKFKKMLHNDLCDDVAATCLMTACQLTKICNRTRCLECIPHNGCQAEGLNELNCAECAVADMDSVEWCCMKEYCAKCRLKEYQNDRANFCWGCRAFIFPRLMVKNEYLRQQLEELQNQEPSP